MKDAQLPSGEKPVSVLALALQTKNTQERHDSLKNAIPAPFWGRHEVGYPVDLMDGHAMG